MWFSNRRARWRKQLGHNGQHHPHAHPSHATHSHATHPSGHPHSHGVVHHSTHSGGHLQSVGGFPTIASPTVYSPSAYGGLLNEAMPPQPSSIGPVYHSSSVLASSGSGQQANGPPPQPPQQLQCTNSSSNTTRNDNLSGNIGKINRLFLTKLVVSFFCPFGRLGGNIVFDDYFCCCLI